MMYSYRMTIGNPHMRILQGILYEELDRLRHTLRVYQKELAGLPKGSIVSKRIKGHVFHYLAYRNGVRMVFKYLGKLDKDGLDKFNSIQKQRDQYRKFIIDVKKQIRFLERALRVRKRRKSPVSGTSRRAGQD